MTYPEGGPDSGYARVTVTVYVDEATAESAARSLQPRGFADCVIGAVKKWFPAAGYDVSERESYVPLQSSSIKTDSHATNDDGHSLVLVSGQFEEELLGGFDNTHNIAQVTGRVGPVVVTGYYATNSQGGDAPRTNALARRLAVAALDRVQSEVKH